MGIIYFKHDDDNDDDDDDYDNDANDDCENSIYAGPGPRAHLCKGPVIELWSCINAQTMQKIFQIYFQNILPEIRIQVLQKCKHFRGKNIALKSFQCGGLMKFEN